MRGEDKRKLRAANLRLLQKSYTFEHIADTCGVSAAYLSQISNEVVQGKDRKTPRALSDNYANLIEHGLGLREGWFDSQHDAIEEITATYKKQDELDQSATQYALEFVGHIPENVKKRMGEEWVSDMFMKAYRIKLNPKTNHLSVDDLWELYA
jgi:transcriptional regulator with XRE-family HTH domain